MRYFNRILPILSIVLLPIFSMSHVDCKAQSKSDKSCPANYSTKKFYEEHLKGTGDYTEATVRKHLKWLSQKLLDLLIQERQKSSKRRDVPYINGDPFTDSQELPTDFQLITLSCSEKNARIKVKFSYDGAFSEWIIAQLIRQNQEWKIDNIYYKNGHHLQGDLKRK